MVFTPWIFSLLVLYKKARSKSEKFIFVGAMSIMIFALISIIVELIREEEFGGIKPLALFWSTILLFLYIYISPKDGRKSFIKTFIAVIIVLILAAINKGLQAPI
ncbi:MAG: hypothetical protein R8G66_24130 [Cytophagales bacterium]|nr:hypothetical protein [Cytophagales bacterium]